MDDDEDLGMLMMTMMKEQRHTQPYYLIHYG